MKTTEKILLLAFICWSGIQISRAAPPFIQVKEGRFFNGDQPYYYAGVNYWYGGLLAHSAAGKERVKKELDILKKYGVNNLRVLAGAEGYGQINGMLRTSPPLQQAPGRFDTELLTGLDFLLTEMNKRNMKAILYLSNNWEWSGGFLQYLNWNHAIADSVLQRKLSWDEFRDYGSLFYSCAPCIKQYNEQLRLVVGRVNSFTGRQYSEDPAIMSWEIANEPRPMRPSAAAAYKVFLHETALLIRSIDKNHLVTTGSEGEAGSETMEIFKQVHADPAIDYLTIHIWPKNWGWFSDTAIAAGFENILARTGDYIRRHQEVARTLGKPLVIEEFGLPRDQHLFTPESTTVWRDKYVSFILNFLVSDSRSQGPVAGVNIWAYSGTGRASHKQLRWSPGDEWLGDPPVEEQGLNSVFDTDISTWQLFQSVIRQLPVHE